MRTIKQATAFKKDFKRVMLNSYHADNAGQLLDAALNLLIADQALPEKCLDHALAGDWKNHRECHIKPDLLLIYQKLGTDVLRLVRLGSHAELFSR